MIDLSGKVAIVTGGGRGIGRATALCLARQGASVAVVARSESCVRVRDEILASGGSAIAVSCDIAAEGAADQIVNATLEAFGQIDILVNNAGITKDRSFLKMSEAEWDVVLDTNLKSVFLLTQKAAPHIIARGSGRIVNIASAAGQKGNFGQANYSASKGGIIALTKTLSIELGRKNVTVNAVSPGATMTDMLAAVPADALAAMCEKIPLRRVGTPEEVAAAVVFLASDEASFITGNVINVNGGVL